MSPIGIQFIVSDPKIPHVFYTLEKKVYGIPNAVTSFDLSNPIDFMLDVTSLFATKPILLSILMALCFTGCSLFSSVAEKKTLLSTF